MAFAWPWFETIDFVDGNFNGDVPQNGKIIVQTKQREQLIIPSPNGLINNVIVLETTSTKTY